MMDYSGRIAEYTFISAICLGVWMFFFILGSLGIWFAVFKMMQLLKKVEGMMEPLAEKSLHVMDNVEETMGSLRVKAEAMMEASEKAVESVAAKVDTTTSLVEGAVARPAISLNSIMAGINRGLETWRHFTPRQNGAPSAQGAPDSGEVTADQPPAV